ncbi:MAG: hypothetical protein JO262_06890, partial [Solirubrobacterales bacterium]|nr:hypothetical protein [Solirubrobacterales bacterium]
GEQLRQGDRQREVELGELEQVVEQLVQLTVVEVSEPAGGGARLLGEVRAERASIRPSKGKATRQT